ncbi:MAG: hypothetical protein ACO1QR_10530 [Chthoniobacteraceae bacterium]
MKTRLLVLGVAFTLAMSLLCSAGVQEPFDTMPVPGNRLPGLEQRLQNLERRLRALEEPKEDAANARPAWQESEYVKEGLGVAEFMLKGGNVVGGANAYREVFEKALAAVKPTTQSLLDLFVTSSSMAMASETLLDKAELDLAKKLNGDALTGLRRCRELKPDWNAKIMDYVSKKVEQRAAELK